MRTLLGLTLAVGGGWIMYAVIQGTSAAQLSSSQLATANNLACQTGLTWLCPKNPSTTSNPPGPQKSKFGPVPQ